MNHTASARTSTIPMQASGPGWVHEINHDGFRLMVRRDSAGIPLITRNEHDWSDRFPLIRISAAALSVRSCLIDGEAVCCDEDGVAVFRKLRMRRDTAVFLYAFDLLELDGVDLRRNPIEVRKEALANLLHSKSEVGLQLNEHFHEAGDVIFRHACKLGLEGIVSKRLGSRYRSGRHISEQAQRQPLQDEDVALVTGKYDADDRNSPKIKT